MFANCLVFGDVIEIQSLVFGQNQMFRHVRSLVLKSLKKMGPFFVNKVHKLSVFVDVGDVRSSVSSKNGDVQSSVFNIHFTSRLYLQTILFVSTTI